MVAEKSFFYFEMEDFHLVRDPLDYVDYNWHFFAHSTDPNFVSGVILKQPKSYGWPASRCALFGFSSSVMSGNSFPPYTRLSSWMSALTALQMTGQVEALNNQKDQTGKANGCPSHNNFWSVGNNNQVKATLKHHQGLRRPMTSPHCVTFLCRSRNPTYNFVHDSEVERP